MAVKNANKIKVVSITKYTKALITLQFLLKELSYYSDDYCYGRVYLKRNIFILNEPVHNNCL